MKDLIEQYIETLEQLERAKETATESDLKVINGMIRDIRYALNWMRTAKQPDNKRGIERRAAYQRTTTVDTLLMQRYFRSTETIYEWDREVKESVISEWDRIKLEDALSTLTENEKEVYMMYKGNCFSMDKISKTMKVSKGTIQTILRRADQKITKQIKESLFCM
ncbi:sigma-70 family RNA polymerase sigma factor [Bacillus pseudomycoides]|uniref:sigma-70 family RNA polymerase sigma factor n=1 Tax=Bacillus pseudomycoides TaxID=64104 RepID=UPI000BF4743A|nr:sigma-70 family RNA polymerase sigma factor [Bacillus pseudomycoides]MED1539108.1 sigma-70 family RNA polymerase sigma factor [Bacillus pseudomycoides]PGC41439.1 RNA polymerase subunit sigma-24 [Bacillus pseudomycoides]